MAALAVALFAKMAGELKGATLVGTRHGHDLPKTLEFTLLTVDSALVERRRQDIKVFWLFKAMIAIPDALSFELNQALSFEVAKGSKNSVPRRADRFSGFLKIKTKPNASYRGLLQDVLNKGAALAIKAVRNGLNRH